MLLEKHSTVILSIVVPISQMAGRLDNLRAWTHRASELPIEIILVHDFRDEETELELKEIVEARQSLTSRISLYQVKYGNPGETRNYGLERATGTWIQFVDSDDFVEAEASLRAIQDSNPFTEVIISNYQTIEFKNLKRNVFENNKNLFDIAINPGIWRMIFRNHSIGQVRFQKYCLGEDQLFLVDFGLFVRNYQFSDYQTYSYYRGVPNQLTSRPDLVDDLAKVLNEMHRALSNSPQTQKQYIAIMLMRLALTASKINSFSPEYLLYFKASIKELRWSGLSRLIIIFSKKVLRIMP